jgi:hypothetical protein
MLVDLPLMPIAELLINEKIRAFFMLIAGTFYWFAVGLFLYKLIRSKYTSLLKIAVGYSLALFAVLFLHGALLPIYSTLSLKSKRPSELVPMINEPPIGDFLKLQAKEFQTPDRESIQRIEKLSCGSLGGLFVSTNRNTYILEDSLKLKDTIHFSNEYLAQFQWIPKNGVECKLAGGFQRLFVFNQQGQIQWRYPTEPSPGISVDNILGYYNLSNDLHIVLGSTYGGLRIMNESGKDVCTIADSPLGQVKSYFSSTRKQQEIIYTLSNNAAGTTQFNVIDSNCNKLRTFKAKTSASEFDLVVTNTPGEFEIIVGDENQILKISPEGEVLKSFPAPGSRSQGNIQAQLFHRNSLEYLAIRKVLFPDLSAFWIFDSSGKIVFQKVDAYSVLPKVGFLYTDSGELIIGTENHLEIYH